MSKIFLLLLFFTQLSKSQICILIHGTWGIESAWHKPGNQFYETLKNSLLNNKIKLITFNWSGKLSYEKRHTAGMLLANLINSYPANTKFILIGHSHGTNVGIIASQLLTNSKQISAFYSLGAPVDLENYQPNMLVIHKFYHLFSFGDMHQTALGMHNRILPKQKNIYNINIEINNIKPQHEDLHTPIIAKWLLELGKIINSLTSPNNHFFAKFYDTCKPVVTPETDLQTKLDYDKYWHERLHSSLLSPYSSGRVLSDKCNLLAS